jgi:hypothetical protein
MLDADGYSTSRNCLPPRPLGATFYLFKPSRVKHLLRAAQSICCGQHKAGMSCECRSSIGLVSYILMNEPKYLWNWSWLVRTGYPQGGRVLLSGSIIKTAFEKKGTVPRPQCPALVLRVCCGAVSCAAAGPISVGHKQGAGIGSSQVRFFGKHI